jgi:FkbM family methyltransferase
MGRVPLPVPEFDDERPWGAYRPPVAMAAALTLAHRVPTGLRPLAKLLRRPVKRGCTTPLDLELWGLKLRLLPRGNVTEQKLYTAPQWFDRAELRLLERRLRPGGVFVDIGANAGAYSFWAHRCMRGSGRIIAVEPDPEMCRRLGFNLRSNDLRAIELCSLALSDHEGMAELHISPQQRGHNTLESGPAQRAGGERHRVAVAVTTLLALLQSKGVDSLDVLKIDIEGHEPPVLRHFLTHAPESMWPGAVISEFDHRWAAEIGALCTGHGYRLRQTTKRNLLFERA